MSLSSTPSVPSVNSPTAPKLSPPTVKAPKLPTKPTKISVSKGNGVPGGFKSVDTKKNIYKPVIPKVP